MSMMVNSTKILIMLMMTEVPVCESLRCVFFFFFFFVLSSVTVGSAVGLVVF